MARIGRPATANPVQPLTLSMPADRIAQLEVMYEQALASRRTSARSFSLFVRDWLVWQLEAHEAQGRIAPPAWNPPPRENGPVAPGSAAHRAEGWPAPVAPPPAPAAPRQRPILPTPERAAPGSIEDIFSPSAVDAFFNPPPGRSPDDSIDQYLPAPLRSNGEGSGSGSQGGGS